MTVDQAASRRLRELALDLAWSLWAELGVSAWERRHQEWAVELEPLIAFTAILSRDEPRLLRESIDWCVGNERYVSLRQLRHVVSNAPWSFAGEVAAFGSRIQSHTGRRWPGAQDEVVGPVPLSGKSDAPDLRRPALVQLRLRALFGVGARAEIIRVLLQHPSGRSVRQISDRVPYTRRQVALDLEMLTASGVLRQVEVGGAAQYAPADPFALQGLVGAMPTVAPDWLGVFRVLTGLVDAFEKVGTQAMHAADTELVRHVRLMSTAVQRSRLALPDPDPRRSYPDDLVAWAMDTFGAIAGGEPDRWLPLWAPRRGS